MRLDALSPSESNGPHPLPSVPSLDQAERDASAHFARLLRLNLAGLPEINWAMLLVVRLTTDLEDTSVRLIRAGDAAETMAPGETALAWVLQGVPRSEVQRRALVMRLASAAAVAWRQHCQIQRLGLLTA